MAQNLNWYNGLWAEMLVSDQEKVDHFKEIDQAIEFGYELPEALKELKHMRNIQSTLPAQVIIVGTKTLVTIEPTVFIQPLNANPATIEIANAKEQNILWEFQQMEKRSERGMLSDLVESALRYDSVAAFNVPVKWQIGGQKGKVPSRYKSALDQGGFITPITNPKDIHARFSALGLDMVLEAKVMRARDACYFYGEAANELWNEIRGTEQEEFFVSVYNHWDFDERIVRISKPAQRTEILSPYGGYTIIKKKMELPFLPWIIKEGGSSMGTTPAHKVRPLLGPIVHAKQLELANIVQSMAFSEATGYAAAPRVKITSMDGETITVEYGDIQAKVVLQPNEQYELLDPPAIDGNLLVIFDRIEAAFNKLTGLRALADLDSPSGTAFATVNAQIKAATTALEPAKKLAERALSGIAEKMLLWTEFTGDDLLGYGTEDSNLGVGYRTKSTQIDPKKIYVSVSLSHHVPTDELQQINAVTILMKEVGISFIDAAKKLDIPNPEEMKERFDQEQLDNAVLAIEIKMMNAEADLKIQEKSMQLQAKFQQQAMAQQAQLQAGLQGGGQNQESNSQARLAEDSLAPTRTGPGRKLAQSIAARGPGFDPSRRGSSPNEVDPEGFTREGATGVDRSGEAI